MATNESAIKSRVRTQLAELVAIPSVSAVNPDFDMSNRAVIECLDDWYSSAGFSTRVQSVTDTPDKANLIARLGPDNQDDGLVLSGHTDTVPFDAGRWKSDPFVLDERDGRWYGLGSADMKCFFPLILAALEGIDAQELRRPLVMVATADEESTMNGARKIAEAGERLGRYVVIGEPTQLIPIHKHKGILIGKIDLIGRSGHSSDPALGANALDCMHNIISGLKAWRERTAENLRDEDFAVPTPTMNLGTIRGGDSPNRICADCELMFDIRMLPGMSVDAIRSELSEIVDECCASEGIQGQLRLTMEPLPAMDTPLASPIVQALQEAGGCQSKTVAFATEGPFFNALGSDSVIFGPGDIATAHQPDEYVDIDRALRMVDILRSLIERFCIHG